MTKEELFNVADQILTMPYKKEDVLYLANYLMENGRQMMLKNADLQIEVAILKEREECAKIAENRILHDENKDIKKGYLFAQQSIAQDIRTRIQNDLYNI